MPDRPLNIVQLAKFYPPTLGGVEVVTRDLAVGFARTGWISRVVAVGNQTRRTAETNDGVIVERSPLWKVVKSQPLSFDWFRRARHAVRSADLVIVHVPNFLAALALLFAPRRPTILFWHSDVADKGLLGRLLRPLEQAAIARSDLIWVTTHDYGSKSYPLADVQDKTALLTLGIPDPRANDSGEPLPAEIAAFVAGRPVVLSVGRLVPYKGFDGLIEAFRRVAHDAVLIIAGAGPEHDRLAAQIAASGLSDRVMLTGRVSKDTLNALFRSAFLYVMSSVGRTEAFGVVQIEAMAYGLPIVATDVPRSGVGWVSGRGDLGALVPIDDHEALGAAINATFAHDRIDELRAASRARYDAMFRIEHMTQNAIDTVASMVGTAARRAVDP